MIACSCAWLSDRDIRTAVDAIAQANKAVNFRAVYRHMGKRARCGNCRALVNQIIRQAASA